MQGAGFALTAHKQSVAEKFDIALRRGKEWEWAVYRFLKHRYPDIRKPLTFEEALGRVDKEPDMSIRGLPVQCKRREFHFTDANDFPFGTILVDEEYKLRSDYLSHNEYHALSEDERKQNLRQFMAYFIANESMSHMAVVIPASKPYWSLAKFPLKRDGRDSFTWECPLHKAIFRPVSEWRTILTWV